MTNKNIVDFCRNAFARVGLCDSTDQLAYREGLMHTLATAQVIEGGMQSPRAQSAVSTAHAILKDVSLPALEKLARYGAIITVDPRFAAAPRNSWDKPVDGTFSLRPTAEERNESVALAVAYLDGGRHYLSVRDPATLTGAFGPAAILGYKNARTVEAYANLIGSAAQPAVATLAGRVDTSIEAVTSFYAASILPVTKYDLSWDMGAPIPVMDRPFRESVRAVSAKPAVA